MNNSAAGAASLFLIASTVCTLLSQPPQIIYNGVIITPAVNFPSGCIPVSMQENEPIGFGTVSGSNYQHIFMTQHIAQGTAGTTGYYIDSAHWSNLPGESHSKENCPDQTYAVFNKEGQMVSQLFMNRNQAQQELDRLLVVDVG